MIRSFPPRPLSIISTVQVVKVSPRGTVHYLAPIWWLYLLTMVKNLIDYGLSSF